jgi:hypothetical protein
LGFLRLLGYSCHGICCVAAGWCDVLMKD